MVTGGLFEARRASQAPAKTQEKSKVPGLKPGRYKIRIKIKSKVKGDHLRRRSLQGLRFAGFGADAAVIQDQAQGYGNYRAAD